MDHETHERPYRRDRPSCVSRFLAPFVFRTDSNPQRSAFLRQFLCSLRVGDFEKALQFDR